MSLFTLICHTSRSHRLQISVTCRSCSLHIFLCLDRAFTQICDISVPLFTHVCHYSIHVFIKPHVCQFSIPTSTPILSYLDHDHDVNAYIKIILLITSRSLHFHINLCCLDYCAIFQVCTFIK